MSSNGRASLQHVPRDVWINLIFPFCYDSSLLALRHTCHFFKNLLCRRWYGNSIYRLADPAGLRYWILRHFYKRVAHTNAVMDAAIDGNVKALKWMHTKSTHRCTYALVPAAGAGQLRVLRWAARHVSQFAVASYQVPMLEAAINGNHKKLLRWLLKHAKYLTWDQAAAIAIRQNPGMFEWILKRHRTTWDLCVTALKASRLDLLPVLEKRRAFPRDPRVCECLLQEWNFKAFRLAVQNGFPVSRNCLDLAIRRDQLDLFVEFSSEFLSSDATILPTAIRARAIRIVHHLLTPSPTKSKLAVDIRSLNEAVQMQNRFAVAQLRTLCDMKVTTSMIEEAVAKREWDFAKELLSYQDCPASKKITLAAAAANQIDVLMLVAKTGGELSPPCLVAVINHGTLEQLEYLLEKKCPTDASVFAAALFASPAVSQCLVQHVPALHPKRF